MHKTIKRIIYAILVLVIISCGISISNNDIYQDGAWFNAQWLGQDIVSLFIAAPVLLLAYYRAFQENRWKWEMVLSGVLFYFAYSYAFYAIVAEFTFLYLLHLPIFGLSVIGLFLVLLHLFQKNIQITSPKRSVKIAVSIFLLLVSAMLSYIWFSDILAHLTIPGHRSDMPDGKPPLIIYSLDLGIVIPLMFTAVVGLWRKRQFGYRLMGVMLTKAATMGFALMGMAISMHVQQLNLDIFLIYLWFFIGSTGLIMTVIYLKNLVLAS